jgi:hypothetical protein
MEAKKLRPPIDTPVASIDIKARPTPTIETPKVGSAFKDTKEDTFKKQYPIIKDESPRIGYRREDT